MTREQIEEQIAILTREITQLNADIQRISDMARRRDELRGELWNLMDQYNNSYYATELELKPLVVFKGKTKDLLKTLRQELEKAQQKHF